MYTSKWITCPGAQYSETKLYWFRRILTLPKAPEKAILHISAEARYKLFINGKRAAFGPCRTSAEEKYYDTLDVAAYLQEGENEIFCPVLQLTETADMTAPRMLYAVRRTGNLALAMKLTCCLEGMDEITLITDDSWEVCPSPVSTFPIRNGGLIASTLEETAVPADAVWQKASVLGRVDCARETPYAWGITNDLYLTPRPIPMLYQKDVTPACGMDAEGYIIMDEENLISLTEQGSEIAQRICARHRNITNFLISLGVDAATAREDACKMEHDLSDASYEAMCRHLNNESK